MQHPPAMNGPIVLLLAAALASGFLVGAAWPGGAPPAFLGFGALAAAAALGLAGLAVARADRAARQERLARAAERLALNAALKAELEGYKRALDRRAGHIRALVAARARAGDADPAFEITPQLAEILTLPPPAVFQANLEKLSLLAPEVAADLTRFYGLVEDARASLAVRRRNWRKRAEVFEELSRVAESASRSLPDGPAASVR